MVPLAKLDLILLNFSVFDPFFAPRPKIQAVLRAPRMDPKPPSSCWNMYSTGHHPQPIGQNRVFKFERPGPPPLINGCNNLALFQHMTLCITPVPHL